MLTVHVIIKKTNVYFVVVVGSFGKWKYADNTKAADRIFANRLFRLNLRSTLCSLFLP